MIELVNEDNRQRIGQLVSKVLERSSAPDGEPIELIPLGHGMRFLQRPPAYKWNGKPRNRHERRKAAAQCR